MKQQQGAALVIVMALLSGALMLGMSGMQSALIDERLAGNYRASVQSQMAGESFLSDIVRDENSDILTSIINQVMESENNTPVTVDDEQLNALMEELSVEIEVTRQDNQITIKAWGSEGRAKAPSVLVFNAGGAAENFRAPFIACQRMRVTGNSLAASCRSTNDACPLNGDNFILAESQNYNLLYSLGNQPGDAITLIDNAQVYGSARSQRDIVLAGFARIYGNAYSQGAICHTNGYNCDSRWTRVTGAEVITTGALQQCDVYNSLTRLNERKKSLVDEYEDNVSDVVADSENKRQWLLNPRGLFYYDESSCEGFDCFWNNLIKELLIRWGYDPCSTGYVDCKSGQVGSVEHSSANNNVVVVKNLTMSPGSKLVVEGGQGNSQNNPVHLKLIVQGEFILGEDANKEEDENVLVIEDNARLELFVAGKTRLNSNLQMGDSTATRNGQPSLIINSSYSGREDAVALTSGSHLVGNIYAPGGKTSLYSSRVTGSIWAQEINVLNNSQIIYNEANVVADSQAIETETANEGGNGFNWQWR